MLYEPIRDLREDQRAIADHAARFKVLACGRRWGKTTLAILVAIREARKGKRVWWVAPTYGMALHPWMTIKAALCDEWAHKLEHHHHIELENGGSITIKSGDRPDSLRGVGLDFVVIDEAAFMPEEIWFEVLRPALADRLGHALLISTPRGRNWFWHCWQRGQDPLNAEWKSWHAPTEDNPKVPKHEIEEARQTTPERKWKQEFLAEFLSDGGEVFSEVRPAADAPAEAVPDPDHRYVMGLDFGRYDDFTAAAVLDATTGDVVALDRFNELDWSVQRNRITALAEHWNVEAVMAEGNSIGEPNIEALREAGVPMVLFTTTRLSKPPLIEGLVFAIQKREIHLLPDEVLLGELEAYCYKPTPTGTVYGAPPGRHDDTVIATALAWKVATEPRLVFGIAEV